MIGPGTHPYEMRQQSCAAMNELAELVHFREIPAAQQLLYPEGNKPPDMIWAVCAIQILLVFA